MRERHSSGSWIVGLGALAALGVASPAWSQVAGAQVYRTLRAEGRARVVVALRLPVATEPVVAKNEMADVKSRVFFDIPPAEFELTHDWPSLSAVAGWVSPSGLAKLLSDPNVERVDVDIPGEIASGESVPLIRGNELRSMGITGGGVTVAVLDTGIDTDHPDLSDDLVAEQCYCTNADGSGCCPDGSTAQSGAGSAEDEHGHGTNVCGIVTGRGGNAPTGVAPDSKLVAIRVLDRDGAASGTAQVLSGLDWIISSQPDVKVVNMSLVFSSFAGACDNAASWASAFTQAINTLRNRGTIVFASSGNNGLSDQIGLPACITSAVGVGAVYDGNVGSVTFGCTDYTTAADQVTCFSNSSSAVDLMAPGALITSTGLGGGGVSYMGTSQASPHAAGAAALLLSSKPGLSPDQIETALTTTGLAVTDPKNGLSIPRIDVRAALDATP
jgi:subtilisin family serine protease